MTQRDLAELLAERTAALEAPTRRHPWNQLTRTERAAEAATIARREAAEAAILEHLRRQRRPVVIGKITLHLTRDRQHFIELDRATGLPVYVVKSNARGDYGWRTMLHDYGRGNRPEAMP